MYTTYTTVWPVTTCILLTQQCGLYQHVYYLYNMDTTYISYTTLYYYITDLYLIYYYILLSNRPVSLDGPCGCGS